MLSEKEIEEIEAELQKLPRRDAGGLEALRIVQKHQRWVSDEAVKDISDLLGMSPESIDSLATFYNLVFRKPVGRHIILICDSITCWIKGYDNIAAFLSEYLNIKMGETTSDDRFTLLPTVCLGSCDKAPVMMVDDDLYTNLTTEKITEILKDYD